eukprot:10689802-Heterocapsa_arctica.AAC.1
MASHEVAPFGLRQKYIPKGLHDVQHDVLDRVVVRRLRATVRLHALQRVVDHVRSSRQRNSVSPPGGVLHAALLDVEDEPSLSLAELLFHDEAKAREDRICAQEGLALSHCAETFQVAEVAEAGQLVGHQLVLVNALVVGEAFCAEVEIFRRHVVGRRLIGNREHAVQHRKLGDPGRRPFQQPS